MSTVRDLSSPQPQRGSVVEPLLLAAPRDAALMFLSPGEEQGSRAAAGLRCLCDSNFIFLLHEAKSKLFANTVDFLVLGFSPDAGGEKKRCCQNK